METGARSVVLPERRFDVFLYMAARPEDCELISKLGLLNGSPVGIGMTPALARDFVGEYFDVSFSVHSSSSARAAELERLFPALRGFDGFTGIVPRELAGGLDHVWATLDETSGSVCWPSLVLALGKHYEHELGRRRGWTVVRDTPRSLALAYAICAMAGLDTRGISVALLFPAADSVRRAMLGWMAQRWGACVPRTRESLRAADFAENVRAAVSLGTLVAGSRVSLDAIDEGCA
jgi:hypothetical protein